MDTARNRGVLIETGKMMQNIIVTQPFIIGDNDARECVITCFL